MEIPPQDSATNVAPYGGTDRHRPPIDCEKNRRETVTYFEERQKRLRVVKTTYTPQGQVLDWIPVESQHPRGEIASPPPPAYAEAIQRPSTIEADRHHHE
jgi:hypothetical protein